MPVQFWLATTARGITSGRMGARMTERKASYEPSAEDVFFILLLDAGAPEPARQYAFHPVRKWRFDFAWERLGLAVEIDGGSWIGGAHSRGNGYARDRVRDAEAILLGWTVARFTTGQVEDGTALKYTLALIDYMTRMKAS